MRPAGLVGVGLWLCATTACSPAAASRSGPPAEPEAAADLAGASARCLEVLVPRLRGSARLLESPSGADGAPADLAWLEGREADRAIDALAAALQQRSGPAGLGQAASRFLVRISALRARARAPGLYWGGDFREDVFASARSPRLAALASIHSAEEAALALQAELASARQR